MKRGEYDEQCILVEYLEMKGIKFTAIPNSTYTPSFGQRTMNKKMGLRPGLPDLFMIVNGYSVWIEMKYGKNKLSEHQTDWVKELSKLDNTLVYVCYSAEEAIEVIKKIVKERR
jgi:hypothetical protein